MAVKMCKYRSDDESCYIMEAQYSIEESDEKYIKEMKWEVGEEIYVTYCPDEDGFRDISVMGICRGIQKDTVKLYKQAIADVFTDKGDYEELEKAKEGDDRDETEIMRDLLSDDSVFIDASTVKYGERAKLSWFEEYERFEKGEDQDDDDGEEGEPEEEEEGN